MDEDQKRYYDKLEAAFEETHQRQLKECGNKGEKDGNRNLPHIDDPVISPYEKRIISKYQAEIDKIFQNGRPHLDELYDTNYVPLLKEIESLTPEKIKQEIKEAEEEKNRILADGDSVFLDKTKDIQNRADYRAVEKDFTESKNRYDEGCEKFERKELHIQFKPYWAYLILIFAIGIAEFPLNTQVFVSFRETPLLTLIMSGVLVFTLPFLAHSSGKFLKQRKEKDIYIFLLIISVVLIVFISYYTATLRTHYLASKGISGEELNIDKWTFFIIGIILYFVGTIGSFFAHDESSEFTEIVNTYQDEKKRFQLKQAEINEAINMANDNQHKKREKILNDFAAKKNEISQKPTLTRQKLNEIIGKHDKTLNYFIGYELKISNCCKEAIHVYRDINLTYRSNHKQPNSWAEELPVMMFHFKILKEISENPING